jgi:glycosyltransferase involved in cell wall biosynthesis
MGCFTGEQSGGAVNFIHRKILIACFEVPGWGGASTACYKLFEMLQKDGLDVSLVNIISEQDAAYFEYRFGDKVGNPRGLQRVFNCVLSGNNYQYQASLHQLIEKINPDLTIGMGWIAAYVLALADPSLKLIYMTTGCGWMKNYIEQKKGNDYLLFEKVLLPHPERVSGRKLLERNAVELSDLIVTHSPMNQQLHRVLNPSCTGKIYDKVVWFTEWIYQDALSYQRLRRPFEAREIYVLLIASDWSRKEKNYPLARKIQLKLKDLNIHVAGEVPEKIPGVTYHSFISDRESLFRLMGNAKAVVSTSLFDASPGILFEASAMQCNVVASRNCGNWQLCDDELLVDPYSAQGFRNAIRLATTRRYHDNLDL